MAISDKLLCITIESAKLILPGFSTADSEFPEIYQEEDQITLQFEDWQKHLIEVVFADPIAFKWQIAFLPLEGERNDCCYEIENSSWITNHVKQHLISAADRYRHYRLNFNEIGQFEILATGFTANTKRRE